MEELPNEALPLRDAAQKLQVSVETLRRRAQRMQKRGESGPFIKHGDEWYVIVPQDPVEGQDMLRDGSAPTASPLTTPAEQFGRVIEQAIAPYAARLEEIAIELGATRNELQHERERREVAERERDDAIARSQASQDESHAPEEKTPQRGAGAGYGASERDEGEPLPKRRGWLARLFGWEE